MLQNIFSTNQTSSMRLCLGMGVAAAATVLTLPLIKVAKDTYKRSELNKKRKDRQELLKQQKTSYLEFLNEQDISAEEIRDVTKMTTDQLITKLKSGELDYQRLFYIFQKAAASADELTNCVLEYLEPRWDDVNLSGPLAGLPVSIKECLNIRKYVTAVGCSALLGVPDHRNGDPVDVLMKLGGAPFVRTNVPQTMMTVMSSNPITGAVLNPHAADRSPGGSSSGEAALLALNGSSLGLGTDIGGSIRLPAAFTGVVGFKPTAGRLGRKNCVKVTRQKLIPATWGPMCRDVSGCITFMHHACSDVMYNMDPELPPCGFNESTLLEKRTLRIGYFYSDGVSRPVPSVARAVQLAKKALESRGHKLIDWQLPGEGRFFKIYTRNLAVDGGEPLRQLLEHDVHDGAVYNGLTVFRFGSWRRRILRFLLRFVPNRHDLVNWLEWSEEQPSVHEAWMREKEADEFRAEFFESWKNNRFDAVICPPLASPAFPVHPDSSFCSALSHLLLFNLTNCPAGTVPVSKVTADDLQETNMLATGYPRSGKLSYWQDAIRRWQKGSEGLPVSVQCAALPWRDEMCLRVMREVELGLQEQ